MRGMKLWFAFLIVFLSGEVVSLDLASPEVFDAIFYIQSNVEVLNAGATDVISAKNHWLQHGIHMGLQGSGNFHSKQYLARYPHLRAEFGDDYQMAVTHYLTHGLHEHRLGYLEGGFEGRWTVSNAPHDLFLSTSSRMGGAVDSLVWNNREFINSWDHGRQMQMAMNFPPNGECYNPTEAGGRHDGRHNSTHTQIHEIQAHGDTLTTKVFPSFWLLPGDHERAGKAVNCAPGMPALNTEATYQHLFSKTVTLKCPGVHTPCLLFNMSFTIARDIPHFTTAQVVAPSTHLTAGFTKVKSVDPGTGHVVSHDINKPTIVSTADDQYALGAFIPPGQDSDPYYYTIKHVPVQSAPQETHKLNTVHKKPWRSLPRDHEHVLNYHTYVCVGKVDDVAECLRILMKPHQSLIG